MTGTAGSSTPEIIERVEQPCMGIRALVPMNGIAEFAARFNELFGWLGAHGVAPAGPPFFRYHVIDMERGLDMEAGVAVAAPTDGDGTVAPGVLPGGRYASLTHVGHPSELMLATKELLDWGAAQGLKWDVSPAANGDQWGCRLENYLTDPSQEPDMSKWETQLAFRLAD